MECIFILLALVLFVIIYNNFFTTIENLENNVSDKEDNKNREKKEKKTSDNTCLSNDPLYLSINNASQINILSKEVNKLQGLKEKVDGIDNRVDLLQKSVTQMTNHIGNAGFSSAGRNMDTIQDPPPKITGLD